MFVYVWRETVTPYSNYGTTRHNVLVYVWREISSHVLLRRYVFIKKIEGEIVSKEKLITKVVRFEINSLIAEEKRLMNFLLKELRFESWKLSNQLVEVFYEDSRFGKAALLTADNYAQKSLQAKINFEMKKVYSKFNTSTIETITQKVFAEWKTSQKRFYKGESRIISYRSADSPLFVRNNQIKLIKEGKQHIIKVRLLSSEYAKQLEAGFELGVGKGKNQKTIQYEKKREGQWLDFEVIVKGGHLASVFERVMTGEYKIGTSQFIYNERKKKWFFNLTYSFVPQKIEVDKNIIMGIDLGVTNPATIAVSNDDWYYQFVGDGEFLSLFKRQVESRKRRLQRSRKWAGKGSVGHGTKTRIKPLETLRETISNFKKTENHKYSKYIVDEAVRLGAGIIQMEDLSGISDTDTFLKDWTFYDLQQKIKYKSKEKGIEVVTIKPNFTSQRCSKCGCINKGNRTSQEKFKCTVCNYEVNADINAARNIATKDIEKIIEQQLKVQEKAIKHQLEYIE